VFARVVPARMVQSFSGVIMVVLVHSRKISVRRWVWSEAIYDMNRSSQMQGCKLGFQINANRFF
jgi:hypothetical protein